jgi:hypothetical protein
MNVKVVQPTHFVLIGHLVYTTQVQAVNDHESSEPDPLRAIEMYLHNLLTLVGTRAKTSIQISTPPPPWEWNV